MTPPSFPTSTTDRSDAARGLSIQQKLPLLMATILVGVLATSLALTYRTLTRAAEATLDERVANVAQRLGEMFAASMRARGATLSRVVSQPLVVRAVTAPANAPLPQVATDSLVGLLARLNPGADSVLPVELWTADGRRVAAVGPPVAVDLRAELSHRAPMAESTADDSIDFSPLFVAGRSIYNRTVVPISANGSRVGYLVQLRQVRSQGGGAQPIRELLGSDISLYIHNLDDGVWTTLDGQLAARPTRGERIDRVTRPRVGALVTATAPIAGTPWGLTLEAPLASARGDARALVLRLALISLALTIVGALVAWLIGRRVTRPITRLTAAAEAISRGDYRSRVAEGGDVELARLARSFNRMAGEVDASHQQLAAQFDEARLMTTDLELAYERLQEAMRDVEEARDEAEHANRAKSDFLAVMSHELRTPLNAIGGYVELLQLGIHGPVTDAQARSLERVMRSHRHLLGLITDVLDFARLGAGKIAYNVHDVLVDDALATVEAMIMPQIEAKGLVYERTGERAIAVRADRAKLQQIMLNVLTNAVKFTPSGGRLSVQTTRRSDAIEIAMRDSGVGIPADRLLAIFEPFVQVDRALNRPHDGVGLGLAISRDLARGMDGDLTVQSEPGTGSTFVIRLPLGDARRAA